MSQLAGDLPVILIGYSFGCVLLPLVATPGPRVLIAPTIGKHDYTTFDTRTDPLLVIASDDDFALSTGALGTWFTALHCPKQLLRGSFDNHFFRGHEAGLVNAVFDFINHHARR
jgi:alpha/beta superfamily hydrolase